MLTLASRMKTDSPQTSGPRTSSGSVTERPPTSSRPASGDTASARYSKARAATIRTQLINVPARLAHRARTIHLYLPNTGPGSTPWETLFAAVRAQPA